MYQIMRCVWLRDTVDVCVYSVAPDHQQSWLPYPICDSLRQQKKIGVQTKHAFFCKSNGFMKNVESHMFSLAIATRQARHFTDTGPAGHPAKPPFQCCVGIYTARSSSAGQWAESPFPYFG